MAQACRVQQNPPTDRQEIHDLDWEIYLRETAQQIVKEQNPRFAIAKFFYCTAHLLGRKKLTVTLTPHFRQLLEIRSRLYELLTHCIPADVIFV